MFRLQADSIDTSAETASLADPTAGGLATFEGRVRNHNGGRDVLRLEYEAFEALAASEGEKILNEARRRFDIMHLRCVHRTGVLEIGETAVWVGASAAHRDAAFKACRYVIDEIKHRLPVWKKETYANGSAEWVNCRHHHHQPELSEKVYYERQRVLPDVGESGQQRLKRARVLVVGAGGLGSAALAYLAGAGVGTLGICEPDTLVPHNLHRQTLYRIEDLGQFKVEAAARHLETINPFVTVIQHPEPLDITSAESLLAGYDLVLDCTDNHDARFVLNDAAIRTGIPLIQAAVYQYEGQLLLIHPAQDSPCLRCLWPAPPTDDCGTCVSGGVLGVVPGLLGTLQATEALKLILDLPTPLGDHLLLADLLNGEFRKIRRIANPDCPVCQTKKTRHEVAPENGAMESVLVSGLDDDMLIRYHILDIREESEQQENPLSLPCQTLPMSRWKNPVLPQDRPILLVCSHGLRSRQLALRLRREGFGQVFSLAGGLRELAKVKAVAQ